MVHVFMLYTGKRCDEVLDVLYQHVVHVGIKHLRSYVHVSLYVHMYFDWSISWLFVLWHNMNYR